jgi:coenzyme F420 hydrogenase subunit beta
MMEYTANQILGEQNGCYVGYATDPSVRANAASGGVVGAISRYLLTDGLVHGVLASRIIVNGGQIQPETIIARKPEDLVDCRNSIYLDFSIGAGGVYQKLVEELLNSKHRIGIVGLYCHLKNLSGLLERRGIPRERVFTVGLFCSHAPHRVLLHQVLERQGADLPNAAAYFTKTGGGERDGRLYGRSTLLYKDGSKLDFPFIEFTTFKNAWFYTPKKCLACPDQFAEIADISCGDAWYKEIRKHPLKQTSVVARTEEADNLVLQMVRERKLELRTLDPVSIIYSQRRVAGVEKTALAARVKLAPLFGIKIPDHVGRIRLRDLAHSILMLSAVKVSGKDRVMRVIMKLPTPVVLVFTLMVKVLEETLLLGISKGEGVGPTVTGFEGVGKGVDRNKSGITNP